MTNKAIFYLPGLNGIRAIAAIIVLIFHIDQFMPLMGVDEIGFHNSGMAGFGVVLFFVLSGYLITLLLLMEKQEKLNISYSKFYIRRVLRIWPLYYLILGVSLIIIFFTEQVSVHWLTFAAYSLLLSNLGYVAGLPFITTTPLWSVGVEEQFYLFWPLFINKSKNYLKKIIIFFLLFLFFKIIVNLITGGHHILYSLMLVTSFSCMAIGGIGACLVNENSKLLRYIYHPVVELSSWLFLGFSVFVKPFHLFSIFDQELHAFVYIIIILNVSQNPKCIVSTENFIMNFIGKISYGIYLWHMTVIYLLSKIFSVLPSSFLGKSDHFHFKYIIVSLTIIAFTIIISTLSYYYFEKPFLNKKKLYTIIKSTNISELK